MGCHQNKPAKFTTGKNVVFYQGWCPNFTGVVSSYSYTEDVCFYGNIFMKLRKGLMSILIKVTYYFPVKKLPNLGVPLIIAQPQPSRVNRS